MASRPRSVLVVGPAWVGDMVIAQSLFRLLKARDPDLVIDVLGPSWSLQLVGRMPEVRNGVVLAAAHGELALGRRRALGRELRSKGYDQAIVLPRSFKSALVPYFARIPVRTGFRTELRQLLLNDLRALDRERLDRTVKRFLALGLPGDAPLPEPVPPALTVDAQNRDALLRRHALDAASAVALMPGAAYGPAKQWPIERFAELAARLAERGRQVWVLGSKAERPLGESIAAEAGASGRNLCGQTELVDTVDLLSAARAAVTNDSGLMHVAAAAGTHVLAIYGSSSPAFTPPLTSRKTIFYLGLACSPCFRRRCPLGHLDCLHQIHVSAVAEEALAV